MILTKGTVHERLQDVLDAVRNSVTNNGAEHCHNCVEKLQSLITANEDNAANMDRELRDFTKVLRMTKMRLGCTGCHPPYYREEY